MRRGGRSRAHLWAWVWLLPALGLALPAQSENSEVKIGRKEHEKLLKTTHFYRDEALNAYIDRVGQKLAAHGDWPEIDYHFFIVDSPGINAFALPGGYIYITRGLLSYLNSEAQLAAVLAHEIAHVTERHAQRRRRQQRLGDVAAFVASATVSSRVGGAIQLENAARVSGYGREMELEADEHGARTLHRAGYDPAAVIEVLSVFKDHEKFSSMQAREAGERPVTYHGLFATHPKNDKRLREAVEQAGELPPGEDFRGRDVYRQHLDNMVFGPSESMLAPPGYQRYASEVLGVTFVFPDTWNKTTQGSTIVLSGPDNLRLELDVAKPQNLALDAEEILKTRHGVDKLRRPRPLYEEPQRKGDAVYAQLDTAAGRKRVAVIKSGSYEYYFTAAAPVPLAKPQDKAVLALIKSFRRATEQDFPPERIKRIYYHRLQPGETFADLAANRTLGRHTELQLRLINGYYPSGQPEPGTWIKMVK